MIREDWTHAAAAAFVEIDTALAAWLELTGPDGMRHVVAAGSAYLRAKRAPCDCDEEGA
ncbi:hypothetical protein [Microbacterium sp. No. 7]|uniref:hypothetical protein n=1 Tax=Microbacterium sp. No. 7 TaxID=1714373 RepID=UPI001E371602|nr:hypothetical protein [Microbacterium sp. No. 7]